MFLREVGILVKNGFKKEQTHAHGLFEFIVCVSFSGEADQRPRDVLPVDPMLASLSHMRQTKFFQVCIFKLLLIYPN